MGTARAPRGAGGGGVGDGEPPPCEGERPPREGEPPPRQGPAGPPRRLPRSGDVLRLTREASVQFATPILFRVIRVHDWPTYNGWVWLDGYQLNAEGDAVERRSIFVQTGGLRWVSGPPRSRPSPAG